MSTQAPAASNKRAMTGQEIIDLSKKHTLFEWSAQSTVDPIPVARAEGIYFFTPEFHVGSRQSLLPARIVVKWFTSFPGESHCGAFRRKSRGAKFSFAFSNKLAMSK